MKLKFPVICSGNIRLLYACMCVFPAVQSSMPQFYEKMKTRLRTVEEGADTIVWLAVSEAAVKQDSGLFFQGRDKA